MKKTTKITLAIVVLLLICSYIYYEMAQPVSYEAEEVTKVVEEEPEENPVEKLANELATRILGTKVEELKKDVVEQIRKDESNVKFSATDVFYTHDPSRANWDECMRTGGRRNINCDSWGPLQFKITTIQHFYKTLYNKEISQKEALLIALDEEKAVSLAQDIIINVEGGVYEWTTAHNRTEYYNTVIPFIRDLEK
jgi:hypothetical protein